MLSIIKCDCEREVAGLSKQVINNRDDFIRSQIEAHSPSKESYSLVARVCNVGVALLVYVRDERVGQRVRDVQTQWTGCGPGWMGNKGAVGVRFRLAGEGTAVGETFTYVLSISDTRSISMIKKLTETEVSSVHI